MKLTNICLKVRPRPVGVKAAAKAIKVPHKNPPNDTCELHWKFGRYVCQLKRLTFNYCPKRGDSRGLRNFLDYDGHKFVDANPQVAVYAYEHTGKAPTLVADYMNGNSKTVSVPNHDDIAISECLESLRTGSGRDWEHERLKKPWISTTPSIQGTWTPFTFKPPVNINPEHYINEIEKT